MPIVQVLLVEDEPDLRRLTQLALRAVAGWEVLVAESGQVALDLAAQHRPDVILLDVMMPGLDGPATLLRLRAVPNTVSTPVIFLTASGRREDLDALAGLGVAGVITKPFDPLGLANQIRAFVG